MHEKKNFEIFLLEHRNSSVSSDSFFVEIFFKINFATEAEIAKVFENTKTNAFTYSLVTVCTILIVRNILSM